MNCKSQLKRIAIQKGEAMPVEDNVREKFEKHTKEVLGLCIDIGVDGEYESDKTRENWLTWQGATAKSSAPTREDE